MLGPEHHVTSGIQDRYAALLRRKK